MHCRKHSMSYKLITMEKQIQNERQIDFIRSLQQTPKSGSTFWLRRNIEKIRQESRCGSAIVLQTKLRRLASSNGKNQRRLNNSNHYGVLRPLEKVSNLNLESALYIIQTAIKECNSIHHQLGYSCFSIRNCFLNQQGKLIIHFNCPYAQIGIPNSDETVIVRDIVQEIHKICIPKCFDDFYNYYKRISVKNKCDFKYMFSLIRSYCKCSKISVTDGVNKNQNLAMQGNYNFKIHPQSALLIQQKVRKIRGGGKQLKMRYKKMERKSFYWKPFGNSKKQGVHYIRNREQIKIKQQFNLAISPTSSLKYLQLSGDKSSINSKQSTISTNFKSSMLHAELIDSNVNFLANKLVGVNGKTDSLMGKCSQNRLYLFLPPDLDQVQSLGESSDPEQDIALIPSREFETPRDAHLEQIKRQNEERILSNNKWTRKFHGLLNQETDIKQSIISSFNKEHIINGSDPGDLVRVSLKSRQNEFPLPSQYLN